MGSPVGASRPLQCIPPWLGLAHDYYSVAETRRRDMSGRNGSSGEVLIEVFTKEIGCKGTGKRRGIKQKGKLSQIQAYLRQIHPLYLPIAPCPTVANSSVKVPPTYSSSVLPLSANL